LVVWVYLPKQARLKTPWYSALVPLCTTDAHAYRGLISIVSIEKLFYCNVAEKLVQSRLIDS
jgi:hypothetical protein